VAAGCLGIAFVIAVVTLVRFSPRYSEWRGLLVSQEYSLCDCYRAFDSLQQLREPWAEIENPTNQVIAWRLLFPLVWHYGDLPTPLYMAMPWLGCLLTLWLVSWCNYRRLHDWFETCLAAMVFATLPWFFVSAGWLTYFDSWLMLGLLALAFAESRLVIALVCLAIPWIDERFVLALPLTLLVRAIVFRNAAQRQRNDLVVDLAVALAASVPYLAVRAIAWLVGDPETTDYVQRHGKEVLQVPVEYFAIGLWSGFRAAWILVGAAVWFTWRSVGRSWGILLGLAVFTASVAALVVARDMSRTFMILAPVLIMGIWQWHDYARPSFKAVLASIAAAQLILPAYHATWSFPVPIRSVYREIEEFNHPRDPLQPRYYVNMSIASEQGQDRTLAYWSCDAALRLDEQFAPAYGQRAYLRLRDGDLDAALADAGEALRLDPTQPEALLVRGQVHAVGGALAQSADDVRQALMTAPSEWPHRPEAEQLLKRIEGSSAGHE
jgi:hypothetical protein